MSPEQLKILRDGIDQIDRRLLELINQRLELVQKVGKVKAGLGDRIVDRVRESEVIRKLAALNSGPLTEEDLQHIFVEIISVSRQIQTTQTVAYLGPEATFTHFAAVDRFGHFVKYVAQPSIRDLFREVEREAVDFGVVPVGDTVEGALDHVLDVFFDSDLKICGEIYVPISFDLLSKTTAMDRIQSIHGHSQAIALCRGWLRKHVPNAVIRECDGTAQALTLTAEQPLSAAVATAKAANHANLKVLAAAIEDIGRHRARFLVIGNRFMTPTGRDKTSIMFVAANQPGVLGQILDPIAASGINLVNIASLPAAHRKWQDYFLIDLVAHIEDPGIEHTLSQMEQHCLYLKCIGSYPMARIQRDGKQINTPGTPQELT